MSSTEFSVALPLVQAAAIAAAEKSILITNPHRTPSDDQVRLRHRRGETRVDVRLLIPGQHNNQPVTGARPHPGHGDLPEGA